MLLKSTKVKRLPYCLSLPPIVSTTEISSLRVMILKMERSTLPLNGEGIVGPVPDIEITPRAVDFGTVAQGQTATQYFTLTNRGTGDLIIESVTIEGAETFALMTDVSGVSYGLEQSSTLVVTYTPTAETGDNAIITIVSNDPDEGEQTVALLGNGGGDFEYPEARFPCPSEVDPPTTVHLECPELF